MAIRISLAHIKLVREPSHLYNIDHRAINGPDDATAVFNSVLDLEDEAQEVVCALYLSTANHILGVQEVTRGTVDGSLVSPREVFKGAILHNATSLILAHNHPSGNTAPSREDIATTERVAKSGKILGIDLLDHIIVGTDGNYRSLKEEGLL